MSSPIEHYLGQLQAKLESRFDSECANQLLLEIKSHLFDSAAELEEEGVPSIEAERLSVQRFDTPEKAAFLLPLGRQFGTGDRYWGWGAFAIATTAALGVAGYAASGLAQRLIATEEIRLLLTSALIFYAYACWRARSFSMLRQSAAVVAAVVMLTGLFGSKLGGPKSAFMFGSQKRPMYAQANLGAFVLGSDPTAIPSLVADLGFNKGHPGDGGLNSNISVSPAKNGQTRLPGMAPIGQSPWDLTQQGMLPEVSRLLLSWLFLILMANAAVCWVGCLEHEQKGGMALIQ